MCIGNRGISPRDLWEAIHDHRLEYGFKKDLKYYFASEKKKLRLELKWLYSHACIAALSPCSLIAVRSITSITIVDRRTPGGQWGINENGPSSKRYNISDFEKSINNL